MRSMGPVRGAVGRAGASHEQAGLFQSRQGSICYDAPPETTGPDATERPNRGYSRRMSDHLPVTLAALHRDATTASDRVEMFRTYVKLLNHAYKALEKARSEEHTSELQSLMRNSYAV